MIVRKEIKEVQIEKVGFYYKIWVKYSDDNLTSGEAHLLSHYCEDEYVPDTSRLIGMTHDEAIRYLLEKKRVFKVKSNIL